MEVLKLILLLYTTSYILSYFLGGKRNILCCGLWCYVGEHAANPLKLKILALYNESRGEHATGLCIDDDVIKDTIKTNEFISKYEQAFDLISEASKNKTVLGHSRQATSFYSKDNRDFAHPHTAKHGEADFLRLVHNGTVTNCSSLAHKYETTMNNSKSDSMLLAEIIAKEWNEGNMNVLREYEGAATVVFYPIKFKNILYVHRDMGRDLFYWNESENAMYISSMKSSLQAIGARTEEIKEFQHGILHKIVKGQIVTTWDLTDKKPYWWSAPATKRPPYIQKSTSYDKGDFRTLSVTVDSTKKRDGFYFEDFLIKFNGHAYLGEVWVEKDAANPKAVKKLESQKDLENYNRLYVVVGHIMKNRESYEKLYKNCVSNGKFDSAKFMKLKASDIAKFTAYPVMGKMYTHRDVKIFWSPELKTITEVSGSYTWEHPLSSMKFTINRCGALIKAEPLATVVSFNDKQGNTADIKKLWEERLSQGKKFKITELYNAFVLKKAIKYFDYDNYLDILINIFDESNWVNKSRLDSIDRQRSIEQQYAQEHLDTSIALSEIIKIFDEYQEYLMTQLYSPKGSKHTHTEVIDESDIACDTTYFVQRGFKDQVLFAEYESLDDILENFVMSEDADYITAILNGVTQLFQEVGLISDNEAYKLRSESQLEEVKKVLSKAFNKLKEQDLITKVKRVLNDDNIESAFAALITEYYNLNGKTGRTMQEDMKLDMLKLAIQYIEKKAIKMDKTILQNVYQINDSELKAICT